MLQLIGYDLGDPRFYSVLEAGVRSCGSAINILHGPWILGSERPPAEVLWTLVDRLHRAGSSNDKLLVVPLGMGVQGAGRIPPHRRHDMKGQSPVVAIAYTLHKKLGSPDRVSPHHYAQVARVIRGEIQSTTVPRSPRPVASQPVCCHPLQSLWFADTCLSPTAVHNRIDERAHLRSRDELLVVEAPALRQGAWTHFRPAAGANGAAEWYQALAWLDERGILAVDEGARAAA